MLRRVPSSARDRRLRRALLAACVAILVVTAGCAEFFDEGEIEGDVDGDPIAQAPANATALVHLDADGLAADGGERLLADLAAVEGERAGTGSSVLAFENRTGLDPLATSELLLFETEVENETHVGYVVDADWSADHLVAAVEEAAGADYDRTEYRGEAVLYEPAEGVADAPAIGVHGDGRFVVGDGTAVRASLDVRHGDAESASGPVRDAYDDARDAHLIAATEQSGSIVPAEFEPLAPAPMVETFEAVDAISRSYDAAGDGIAIELGLHAPDERTATEVETTVPGALAYLAESPIADEALADALEDVGVTREGTTVWLAYEGDVDAALRLFDEV